MLLSDYAKKLGIQYRTAWNHYKAGKIPNAYQLPSGTIIIPDETNVNLKVAIYTRVSSSENKQNLDTQLDRVRKWSILNGYKINSEVQEIGSGLNDNRPKLLKLLNDVNVGHIIVEHKDRLTRFGFNYIKALLESRGGSVIVINEVESNKEDLIQDFVSVITSFCFQQCCPISKEFQIHYSISIFRQVIGFKSSLNVILSNPILSSAVKTLFVLEFKERSLFPNVDLEMANSLATPPAISFV